MAERRRVILIGIEPDDFVLAARAVRSADKEMPGKDMIVAFNDPHTGAERKAFYLRKNKASLTVSECSAS